MSLSTGKFKTKPYKHQLECLTKHSGDEYYALLAEMGTGKTWIMINDIAEVWSRGELNGVLVFAPNGVHTNWTNIELPTHMPDWVRYRMAAWNAGANKKEQAKIDALFNVTDSTELRIFTMNWEALQTERGFEIAKRFCNSCSKLMIVGDETTMIKNPAAIRTKSLMKLKRYSSYRRIMNGSPVTESPFDVYSQFNFLSESILGTSSYYSFKAQYAEMLQEGNRLLTVIKERSGSRFTPQIVAKGSDGRPHYKNLDKLEALISKCSYRVLKKDCLDLPEKIYKTIFYTLTPKQRKAYDLMKEQNRVMLEDESVPVANKLVALGKLAQICSGYIIPPNSTEPIRIEGGSNKLKIMAETVERAVKEQKKKIIIWARYHVELDDIYSALKELGLNCVRHDGRCSKKEREAAKTDFQFGDADVFIGQQKSGGVGITLTAASIVIYFSNDFSAYYRIQSEDRAHRIGQKEDVLYLDFVGENTIEQTIIKSFKNKKRIADIITGDNVMEMI